MSTGSFIIDLILNLCFAVLLLVLKMYYGTNRSLTTKQQSHAASTMRTRGDRAAFVNPGCNLKAQTQHCILGNKKYFYDLTKLRPGWNPFSRISNTMRKELVEKEAKIQADNNNKDVELQCKILQLLINEKVTSFHFPTGLTLPQLNATAAELWQTLLAEQPSDLHTIVSKGDRSDEWALNWDVQTFFDNMLPAFPNLEVLQLQSLVCNDDDLVSIADHFPKLRVLEVQLSEEVSRQGISALCKLHSLEEFLFFDSQDDEDEKIDLGEFLRWTLELLPLLHVVLLKPAQNLQERILELGVVTSQALSGISSSITLQLRHLALSDRVPDNVTLPHLQSLYLLKPAANLHLDTVRFAKLSDLNLLWTSADNLMRVLGHFGRRLQKLSFTVHDGVLQLDGLFRACPNLSELSMGFRGGSLSASRFQPDTLKRLRTLDVVFSTQEFMQPGLLLDLLRTATKLRSLELIATKIGMAELKEWAELAKQRTCMRRLEKITFKLQPGYTLTPESKYLDFALYYCIIHCARLEHVVVEYNMRRE